MKIAFLPMLCILLTGCSQPQAKVPAKQYALTGKIVSIDLKEHTALVDAAPIPNFMDAMKMDYPIASEAELQSLKAGEEISATVNMNDDGSYTLSNIRQHDREHGAGK